MNESSMILLFIHPPPVDAMQCTILILREQNKKKHDLNEILDKFSNLGRPFAVLKMKFSYMY
jgi:hypothetical protein